MTHSTEVEWINSNNKTEFIFEQIKDSVHSKFIVGDGSIDKVLGVINIKDFYKNFKKSEFNLSEIISHPIYIIQSTPAFKILNTFKSNKQYIAIVVDELGIITLHDLIEAIVGDLPAHDETGDLNIVKRGGNSYLIDGRTLIFELNQYFQKEIIEGNISQSTTIAGFLLSNLHSIPSTGEKLLNENYEFEIIDMDGVKIDKVCFSFK